MRAFSVSDVLLSLRSADLGYGRSVVLRDVNSVVRRGESVGLVGPNGSGKTTFLLSVLGLIPLLRGSVELDRSRRFAYVPQSEAVNPFWPLSLRETVCLPFRGRRAFGRVLPEEREAVRAAMEKTGIEGMGDLLFREASGGQRQRTILAQALAQAPEVLFLDEPTRGLDIVAERDLLVLIRRLKSSDLTLFVVSHSLHIPLNYTERILLFNAGRVIESTPDELVRTRKLEEIYGVPFAHHEMDGYRWAAPAGSRG